MNYRINQASRIALVYRHNRLRTHRYTDTQTHRQRGTEAQRQKDREAESEKAIPALKGEQKPSRLNVRNIVSNRRKIQMEFLPIT